MKVSGTAILARKVLVTTHFGGDAWRAFFAEMGRCHPSFRVPLARDSLVPIADFQAFHDEFLRRFYNEDSRRYFQIGEESATWALTQGPYRELAMRQDLASFVAGFPRLWLDYFAETESSCQTSMSSEAVEIKAFSLPNQHPYFEYLVVGYLKGALELLCANPIEVQRVARDTTSYHYRLRIGFSGEPFDVCALQEDCPASGSDRCGLEPSRGSRPVLSQRELDVVRLVARGKTNKEIGSLLRISWRTVQNHLTSIYTKLGVYSRAGATAWLLETEAARDQAPPSKRA